MSHKGEGNNSQKVRFDLFKVMRWNKTENDGLMLTSQADTSHFFGAYEWILIELDILNFSETYTYFSGIVSE